MTVGDSPNVSATVVRAAFLPTGHSESLRAPSPLCKGAFFFRVKVRYWVEKVRKILKTQAGCDIMVIAKGAARAGYLVS